MSPTRAPPGDAVARCRDAIEAIISAPGHKYNCEKNELLQLLSQSHVQVSERMWYRFSIFRLFFFFRYFIFVWLFHFGDTETDEKSSLR